MKPNRASILTLAWAAAALAGCSVGTAQTSLRSAVDAQQVSLDACYREALARDASVAGDMGVRLTVAKQTEAIRDVTPVAPELADPELVACVTRVLSGLSIDEAPGTDMAVTYTLRFEQGQR